MAESEATKTTDHDTIRRWIETRGGRPATVAGTEGGDAAGVLTVHFPGQRESSDADLSDLSWEDFFDKFESENLAFLHQDRTADGDESRFFRFVNR